MNKTIPADTAEELYELLDDHGTVDPNVIADETTSVDGWTLIGSQSRGSGRWHANYTLIVRDDTGATWGLSYGLGLTEEQEDELPWEQTWQQTDGQIVLERRYPHEVTTVQYRRGPAPGRDADAENQPYLTAPNDEGA